jgi:Uma2 family endonuclease
MATVEITQAPLSSDSRVPESELLYEIVNGQRVECPPMGVKDNLIAAAIQDALAEWNANPRRGWVTREDLFQLTGELQRRPDVAFVAFADWPHDEAPDAEAWSIPPTLAVEVVSRWNSARDVQEKISEYFEASTKKVWVVYPSQKNVYCYDGVTDVRVIDRNGTIDGGNLLPGFSVTVESLFATLKKPKSN